PGPLSRLVLSEYPDAELEVHVPGGDAADLAGPGAGLHHCEDELAKRLVLDGGENLAALIVCEHAVPKALRRPLYAFCWVGPEHALGVGPVECPLHGDHRIPAASLPAGVGVEPAGDVERLEVLREERAEELAEGLEEIAVAAKRVRLVVLLGPVEEEVTDDAHLEVVGPRHVRRIGGHEPVEGEQDRLRRVPAALALFGPGQVFGVLAEGDLRAPDLDVPGIRLGAVPRTVNRHRSKPPVETRVSREACSFGPGRVVPPGAFLRLVHSIPAGNGDSCTNS